MAATMAVGVASTSEQGQNTTSTVTARKISPVTRYTPTAEASAPTTTQVAQRSARRTIFALPASALCTRRAMRRMELSSPTRVATTSMEPNWLTVPAATSSPGCLSTGIGSPVTALSSMLVEPETTVPSTGIASPGSTRTIWLSLASSASISCVVPSASTTRARRGASSMRRSMPRCARATVSSSKSPPSCMMSATSPAAKYSPMQTEAISASDTSRSAFTSNSVTMAMRASMTMGAPHSTIATHAGSMGRLSPQMKLAMSATAEMMRKTMSRVVPPSSSRRSSGSK